MSSPSACAMFVRGAPPLCLYNSLIRGIYGMFYFWSYEPFDGGRSMLIDDREQKSLMFIHHPYEFLHTCSLHVRGTMQFHARLLPVPFC